MVVSSSGVGAGVTDCCGGGVDCNCDCDCGCASARDNVRGRYADDDAAADDDAWSAVAMPPPNCG